MLTVYVGYALYNNKTTSLDEESLEDKQLRDIRGTLNLNSDEDTSALCVRDECCDENMVYNDEESKCVEAYATDASETEAFGNMCASDLIGSSLAATNTDSFYTQSDVTN